MGPGVRLPTCLGLDLGLTTGWAFVQRTNRKPEYAILKRGVEDFRKNRGDNYGDLFTIYREWLIGLIAENSKHYHFDVCYEKPHNRGGAVTEILYGMSANVKMACSVHGIDCSWVLTNTLKKQIAGSGVASKDEVKAGVKLLTRCVVKTDHEADATGAAICHLNRLAQPSTND